MFRFLTGLYFALILIFLFTVVGTVKRIEDIVKEYDNQRQQEITEQYQRAPERCAEYYNNGTEEWIDCMGVGYNRGESE